MDLYKMDTILGEETGGGGEGEGGGGGEEGVGEAGVEEGEGRGGEEESESEEAASKTPDVAASRYLIRSRATFFSKHLKITFYSYIVQIGLLIL
jgi:hypothetical protein